MDAPQRDPYAPPASDLGSVPAWAWAERALLVVLSALLVMVATQMVLQLRAGVPFQVLAFVALYELGLPGAALLLVLLGRHVGYLLSLTAGSMFASLSPPVVMASPFWGGLLIALSVSLWGLSWFAARGRFGYLFKRPRQPAGPRRLPRA